MLEFVIKRYIMEKQQTFTATIQNAGGGGAFVEVPFDVEAAFGSKRPKVRALIEGVPYRGILTRMGTECHLLIVLKEIREKIGKTFGDEVRITVEPDTEPRVIEIPAEVKKAFKTEKEKKRGKKKEKRGGEEEQDEEKTPPPFHKKVSSAPPPPPPKTRMKSGD